MTQEIKEIQSDFQHSKINQKSVQKDITKYIMVQEYDLDRKIRDVSTQISNQIMDNHVCTTRRFGYFLASIAVLLFIALFLQDFFILHLLQSS